MRLLIQMVSIYRQNKLLPGTESVLDQLQRGLSDLKIGEMVK